jgi:hypothetical protein
MKTKTISSQVAKFIPKLVLNQVNGIKCNTRATIKLFIQKLQKVIYLKIIQNFRKYV